MGVAFFRGQQLGGDDLNIYTKNSSGVPTNAAEITYALYDVTTGAEALIGVPRRVPANSSVGCYFVSIIIPLDANLGLYRVRWTFRELVGGPEHQAVQEFEVVDKAVLEASSFTECETTMIRSLRIMLRDNSPDRNYHFRPPAHEASIRQYNQVFGYIWEDEELREYLLWGLDDISSAPPATPVSSCQQLLTCFPQWRTLLLNAAMQHALLALTANWIADEFDYSIGGVSLSIDKSSKYQNLLSMVTDQFDKRLERAKSTVKIVKGLQQPRYGVGVRSAFGPHVGKSTLTPRKFLGF